MARHIKKSLIAGVFALSCAFILASCDSVEALPNNYKDPIIAETEGNEAIYQNEMSVIYDAIASGKNEKVVDEMLKVISNAKYGTYYGEGGLREAYVASTGGDDTKLLAFVKAHKAFYSESDSKVTSESFDLDKVAMERAKEFAKKVQDKINKHFVDEVKNESYRDEEGIYQEQKLAYSYYSQLYELAISYDDLKEESNFFNGFITSKVDEDNVGSYVHFDYYKDYIERKILPDVYKDKIVEDYILANNYSVLGRSYGRKVNIVKLSYEVSNKTFADDLFRAYATAYIKDSSDTQFEVSAMYLEEAWRGFSNFRVDSGNYVIDGLTSQSTDLLTAAGKSTPVNVDVNYKGITTLTAIKDTQLGNLVEEYQKAIKGEKSRFASEEETAAINKFTDSGKHPKEKGLVSEILKLAQTSSYTDGWYVKNGGLSEFPSDLRDRVFNINVSNALDNPNFNYEEGKSYVRPIELYAGKKNYFLLPTKSEKQIVNPLNFIFSDTATNSFYICEVEEAPSTSKLNLDNVDTGYVKDKASDPLKSEVFAREISRVISTRDSYVTSAYTEEFKKCDFIYHDDAVYDYFKLTYPDLFE